MAVYAMDSPYVMLLCVSSPLFEVKNLKQLVPLECRITDCSGLLAEWDPEHTGKID